MPPDPQSLNSTAMLSALAGGGLSAMGTSGIASSLLGMRSAGTSFVGILQSRTVQDKLIDRFDLRLVYWSQRYQDARRQLSKRTAIEEDKKTGIIRITVTDRDRKRAQDMAGAYVQELDNLVARLSTSGARRERTFLEERLVTVKADLDSASRELSQFSSKNATFDMQVQGKAMMEAAATLQGELIAAHSQLSSLQATYSDENVRVRSLKARINELQRQLRKMGGSDQTADAATLSADSLYPPLRQLPLLGVKYYDLYRKAKIQEAIYEVLTKEYELAKVQEAREIPTVKVLDAPDWPERKSFPPRTTIVVFGALLSLIGGMAWIVGDEFWAQVPDTHPAKEIARDLRYSITRPRKSRIAWLFDSGRSSKPEE
jgi:capsule polysaccharide export protein KpsE/RkpR